MNRSSKTRLLIRRFFALYIISSTIFSVVREISTGDIQNTLGGAIVGVFIFYFLWRIPKSIKEEIKIETTSIDSEFNETSTSEEIYIDDGDLISQNETVEFQKRKISKSFNPIKDKDNIISKMFKGNTERY